VATPVSSTETAGRAQGSCIVRERRSGMFGRSVTLPVEVDADKVKAEYRDGMLALYLPRAKHEKDPFRQGYLN